MNVMQNAVCNLTRSPISKPMRNVDAQQFVKKTAGCRPNTLLTPLLLSLSVLLSLPIAPLAQAQTQTQTQIMKCRDLDGSIIYSDVACGNAEPMRDRSVDESDAISPTATGSKNTIPANKILTNTMPKNTNLVPLRQTEWANRSLPATKKSLDQLTIRDARFTLTASDQATASLRQQTLASNR